jgi:hypothetical protein
MRRRLVGSVLAVVGACSYAGMPAIHDTGAWHDPKVAQRCRPDTLLPRIDSVGVNASYTLLVLSSLVLVGALIIPDEGQIPTRDVTVSLAVGDVAISLLGVRYYGRSRRHGYETATRCQALRAPRELRPPSMAATITTR